MSSGEISIGVFLESTSDELVSDEAISDCDWLCSDDFEAAEAEDEMASESRTNLTFTV